MPIRRKTRTSKRVESYANRAIKTSRNALLSDICEGMYKEFVLNNHRLPYGHVTKLVDELKPKESWISRNIINKAFIKYRANQKKMKSCEVGGSSKGVPDSIEIEPNLSTLSDLSNVSNSAISYQKVGRPNGSTAARKESKRKKLIDSKNEITKKYVQMMKDTKRNNKARVSKGSLEKLINEVKKKRNIEDNISLLAIRKRVQRNSLESRHLAGGQVSPLLKIEPVIVSIIVQMARMRQCLNPSKGLLLVNSLIRGTKIKQELIEWKQKNTPNSTGTDG